MARPLEIFLDIETDWYRRITVVGFYSSETGFVQLVGRDITRKRLLSELPRVGRLFTYNGHCFDLPVIERQLRIDLRSHLESLDLRWICQRHAMCGGQKHVERRLGLRRRHPDLDGLAAIRLWQSHLAGEADALPLLRAYNREDVFGLRHIKRRLSERGLLDF